MGRGVLTTISVFATGIFVIVAGFFLLNFEKNTINYWAFGSLFFALVASMFVMISVIKPKRNKEYVLFRSGMISAISIYLIVVVTSVLMAGLFAEHINNFIYLQFVINAIFLIVTTIVVNVSAHKYAINEKTAKRLQDGEYNTPKRGGF